MKLGQGIEQPDGKTVTGIQICSSGWETHRATDSWVHTEQLTHTNTDMDTCIHSYTHTDTRVC